MTPQRRSDGHLDMPKRLMRQGAIMVSKHHTSTMGLTFAGMGVILSAFVKETTMLSIP